MVQRVLMCVCACTHMWAGHGGGPGVGHPAAGEVQSMATDSGRLAHGACTTASSAAPGQTAHGQQLNPLFQWGHRSWGRTPRTLESGQNRGRKPTTP